MSMNLIAMLVSLAMMLTGAGGAVRTEALPATMTARTLTLSNVSVTWNGEPLHLAPQAHIGVSTDGNKAVYDFGIDLDGKTLLPVQLVADDQGLTALSGNSGVAVNVTAEALAGLAEQLEAQLNASMAAQDAESAELMQFFTGEYMPAYTGLLQLAMDPGRYEEINASSQKVFDRMVDRGEGTPTVLDMDGARYDVTAYSYSMDAMQMAALSDAIFNEIPELGDYYRALFRLYDMTPEESGLKGLDSFSALFERFGIQMQMDIDEQRNADGTVSVMDSVLTFDPASMLAMPQAMAGTEVETGEALPGAVDGGDTLMQDVTPEADAAAEPTDAAGSTEATAPTEAGPTDAAGSVEAEAPAQPALEPIVMNLHSLKIPDYQESNASCVYALDERHSVDINMTATDNAGVKEAEMTAFVTVDGRKAYGGKLSAFLALDETGTVSYSLNMKAAQQDRAKVDASVYGVENPDGTSQNSVLVEARTRKKSASVAFDLNVTADAVEDKTGSVEPACVIDDLSEAGLQDLGSNPAAIGALMKALGSLTADFNTLKRDPGMKTLWSLARGKGLPIDVDDLNEAAFDIDTDFGGEPEGDAEDYELAIGDDGEYELVIGDGEESPFDFDEEPVEDDGVLAFAQPKLSWLPEGWKVSATETDTAYDWVQLSIADASENVCAYAIFFLDPEASTANYIVQEDGKVVDGRMMNVTDFGEGGLSVTVSENGMYGNLMFTSEAIELDTIGKIVAGIEF